MINPPTEYDDAFSRLREGQGLSHGDLLGDSDTVSHYKATDGDRATGPAVNDRFYEPETDSDSDPDVHGFYKLRIIFVLREEDAIVKATVLRFVDLANHNNACFANMNYSAELL